MKNKLVSKINENCWLEEAMVNHVVWTNGIFPLNSSISLQTIDFKEGDNVPMLSDRLCMQVLRNH